MNGKIVGIFLALTALAGGAGVYFLNVYAFYEEVPGDQVDIRLTLAATERPEAILVDGIEAIDATSSPLRFRACFATDLSHTTLTETYVVHPDPVPLTGPGWFDCYDADAIGAALRDGRAVGVLAEAEVRPGVDRVVAIFDDGRGFAWHQLNEEFAD